MISSARTSASSIRAALRTGVGQQALSTPTQRSTTCQFSSPLSAPSSSSSSSSAASTSRLVLPSSSRGFQSSATTSIDSKTHSSTPSRNVRLTPKAAHDVDNVQAWLRNAFPNLPFPNDIALQMITHESWDHGVSSGHNRRLSFIGRRAMKFYLTLFLIKHSKDSNLVQPARLKDLLNTQKLGDNVGRSLKLGEVMRWMPAVDEGQKGPKETGLYRIRGVAVESLLGAIYHQHGAQAAMGFFSAKILPTLNTFSEEEAEALKGAIVNEREASEGSLQSRTLSINDSGVRTRGQRSAGMEGAKESIEASHDKVHMAEHLGVSSNSKSPPASAPTSARRRTTTTSTTTTPMTNNITLEEETGSSSLSAQGRSIS
ncbi:hypothetical protein CBS101457_006417 [Exobasidium rhododendri]|nr:hypothetical protein CBS101457_006417 [Exobasidium rhododendri]